MQHLAHLRENYAKGSLDFAEVRQNPFEQFETWFSEASHLQEPNAMHLATVSDEGRPSARIVLLKGLDSRGFVWFTNYLSRKSQNLNENPYASLTFFWVELERQVRIEGRVEKTSPEDSDAYFAQRPRGSQIGAWASEQSSAVPDRATLEANEQNIIQRFEGQEIPRPEFWGGFRLVPNYFEFWQGRPSRLHDRIAYTHSPDGNWSLGRLSP